MRSGEFGWHGCAAPIPKDACTGFEKARGEFFAYPTGCWGRSRRRRASDICRRGRGTARRKRSKTVAADTGSNRFGETRGFSRAGDQGEPSARGRGICRSFVSVFVWRPVASGAGCQRRLGVGPILAIAGQRRAGNRSGVAGENRTRPPVGAGSAPSQGPCHYASDTQRGASRSTGAQQGG